MHRTTNLNFSVKLY